MNETLRYTQLGLAVAALLDKEEPLDAGQARQYIEDGSLFSWLGRRYDGEIDLSLLRGRRPRAVPGPVRHGRYRAHVRGREQRPGPASGLLLRGPEGDPLLQRLDHGISVPTGPSG